MQEAQKNEIYFLGIDGGGTKCKALLMSDAGECLGIGVSGPANPLIGIEQTIQSITTATSLALTDAKLESSAVEKICACIGLAGVNLPNFHQSIRMWEHPFKYMTVTTDLHIACLAAHAGGNGAVIITGTGSCGYANVDGRQLIVGAHGFPYGDKASGAWFGLEAFRYCLLSLDNIAPDCLLVHLIMEHFASENAVPMIQKMVNAPPYQYAKLAPLVFQAAEQGDTVAKQLIQDAASYVAAVASRLFTIEPPRTSLIGGLSSLIMPHLDIEIVSRFSAPYEQPEVGAAHFAQQEYLHSNGKQLNTI